MGFFNKIKLEKIRLDIQKFRGVVSDYKIIHLSDLHISRCGYREKELVSLVELENPDVIVITGDLVNSYQDDFSACIQTLKKMKAAHGIFAVFGNAEHTFKPIHHVHNFEKALEDIGVVLLNNRSLELKLNGRKLYLVGVDDPFFLFDQFEQAIQHVPRESPVILLAHSPDILLQRTDALVINLLDSELKKNHHKGWGWADSTTFGPEKGDVFFENDGNHTIRVQSRQDGVSLDTILLNPYEDIDQMLDSRNFKQIELLLSTKELLKKYPDLIVIPASNIDKQKVYGKWKITHDPSALCNCRVDDMPPMKWHYQPLISPENYFEANLSAKKGMKYHVWIRMNAHKGSPFNDSVYLQFNDSTDEHGRARYRISEPAYSKERMSDVDLVLTGHTHGGQIRLPVYGPIATMTSIGKKYASGLHRFAGSLVYISRGFGTSVVPFRLLCPPEVTVFTFN